MEKTRKVLVPDVLYCTHGIGPWPAPEVGSFDAEGEISRSVRAVDGGVDAVAAVEWRAPVVHVGHRLSPTAVRGV